MGGTTGLGRVGRDGSGGRVPVGRLGSIEDGGGVMSSRRRAAELGTMLEKITAMARVARKVLQEAMLIGGDCAELSLVEWFCLFS